MTWKEFKNYVEARGVNDNTVIAYIDVRSEMDNIRVGVIPESGTLGQADYEPEKVEIEN